MASSSFLYLLFGIIHHVSLYSASQDYFFTSQLTHTSNSTFEKNLNATIFSLRANSLLPTGFRNTSAGEDLDQVYGFFLSRGVSAAHCQSCIKASTEAVIKICPKRKEAIIWFDHCMIRYLNRSIFSVMEDNPKLIGLSIKELLIHYWFNQL